MKENSGFTNWETRRMMEFADKEMVRLFLDPDPSSATVLAHYLGKYERRIMEEGFKSFVPYNQEPVNYWEILCRLMLHKLATEGELTANSFTGGKRKLR